MKGGITLCAWAAATSLMLCTPPVLSFALNLKQTRLLRFPNPTSIYDEIAHFPTQVNVANLRSARRYAGYTPSRKRLRRDRPCMMDADSRGHMKPFEPSCIHPLSPAGSSSPLRTAMDTMLPFGRLVGVELPQDLNLDDALRVAAAELLPEELHYCSKLHPAMQVGDTKAPQSLL